MLRGAELTGQRKENLNGRASRSPKVTCQKLAVSRFFRTSRASCTVALVAIETTHAVATICSNYKSEIIQVIQYYSIQYVCKVSQY